MAELVGARVQGDADIRIGALNGLEFAEAGELTYILEKKQISQAETSRASAVIVPPDCALAGKFCLIASETAVAVARIHAWLLARPFMATSIHPTAVIGENCSIPEQVSIGPGRAGRLPAPALLSAWSMSVRRRSEAWDR